jgi:hypothetical protein
MSKNLKNKKTFKIVGVDNVINLAKQNIKFIK